MADYRCHCGGGFGRACTCPTVLYDIKTKDGSTSAAYIPPTTSDMVTHPPHYTWLKDKCGVEVWDITQWLPGNLANVVKYVLRADFKGATIEDLNKARQYLDHEIERLS